jgi:membrane associated rhomboid family serine protease
MIVIPTGTDAPIYHWPYATVGLIILNVLLFFVIPPVASPPAFDENGNIIEGTDNRSNFERYSLAVGDGHLHPIQWITHNFLHLGFLHLAGNLLFLWAFGIVVEGKLGPAKYLATYLAIGALHGAFVQVLLLKSGLDQHAAGASAMIYGLLAACMIWAPRNELYCTVILTAGIRFWVFRWELYYTTVALYYIATQALGFLFWGAFGGQLLITELGHLSGAFWGAVVAIGLLKAGLVDCEGWDLFSLWAKRQKLARAWKKRAARLDYPESHRERAGARDRRHSAVSGAASDGAGQGYEAQSAQALGKIHALIEAGDIPGAIDVYHTTARTLFNWPSQLDLYSMIKALHARGYEAESVPLMRDHCRCYPEDSTKVALKLAQILITKVERPAAALRVLERSLPSSLPLELEQTRQRLALKAKRMREAGAIELEGDD